MKSMLKTSRFDRLEFEDPKKQLLAEELMQRETQKGNICLEIPLFESTVGSMSIFLNDTKDEVALEIDALQKKVKTLELKISNLKKRIYDLVVEEITRLVKIFRNQQKVC
jgi:hypothetical protein